jgi:hypothetical protein
VAQGESFEVTDRGQLMVLLVPAPAGDRLERPTAEGRLSEAVEDVLCLGRRWRRGPVARCCRRRSRSCVPTNGDVVTYLDLVRTGQAGRGGAGIGSLVAFLGDRPVCVSCAVARVEVIRAVPPQGPAVARARRVLARIRLLRLDDELLDDGRRWMRALRAAMRSIQRPLGGWVSA